MKTIIIACLLSLGLSAQIDDKTKHFYAGFGITVISAEVCNQITDRPALSALSGFALGTLAGIIKESIYDKAMDKGTCSNTDAFMTSWGSACGALVIRVRFDLRDKKNNKQLEKLEQQKYNSL